eukprot:jgi/Picsp_1/2925/NSC_01150-R1_nudix hydrolase
MTASNSAGEYTYAYPRPAVTVDYGLLLLGSKPEILLIQRKNDPFAGKWALPGGFVDEGEKLDVAAEETSIDLDAIPEPRQIGTFGDPGRDPRGWTVTVVFAGLCNSRVHVKGADDAAEAKFFSLDELPPLAFDHDKVISELCKNVSRWEGCTAETTNALVEWLERNK